MEKYYFKTENGMALEECPIGKKTTFKKSVVLIGGQFCLSCKFCESRNISEQWIKCKHVSKKSNKGILIKIAAVLVYLALAAIASIVIIDFVPKIYDWIFSFAAGFVLYFAASYIWNLSNKK